VAEGGGEVGDGIEVVVWTGAQASKREISRSIKAAIIIGSLPVLLITASQIHPIQQEIISFSALYIDKRANKTCRFNGHGGNPAFSSNAAKPRLHALNILALWCYL
jgi:hypothetical protein